MEQAGHDPRRIEQSAQLVDDTCPGDRRSVSVASVLTGLLDFLDLHLHQYMG